MSGGSFNYLYAKGATELMESGMEDLDEMADELEALGHLAGPAAEETRAIEARLRDFEGEMNERISRIRRVWHAIEWWRSSDWSRDQALVALGEWRECERSRTRPTAAGAREPNPGRRPNKRRTA